MRAASPTCASLGLSMPVRDGEGQDGFIRWACATSTSLVCTRICNTTSAVRPTLLGRPPILAWRERGIIGKTLILAEDHELPIFALYSRTRTPRVVRIMHPKPKLNFNASEPDYGLLSELTMPSPRLIRCLFVQKGRRRASLRLRRRSRSARSASRSGAASPGCEPLTRANRRSPRSCEDWSFPSRMIFAIKAPYLPVPGLFCDPSRCSSMWHV